jgi:hypothetical protein
MFARLTNRKRMQILSSRYEEEEQNIDVLS